VWEENEDVRSCFRCKKRFGVITWKHHCRACGRIMCKKCTRFYTKLPVSELCPDCPGYISNKLPQRCCLECSERVRAHLEAEKETAQRRQGKTVVGVKIIDSIEYIPSYHSKVYVVQIPQDRTVHANQMLRVVLGGRLNHVNVPYGVGPGHLLYVRANDVFVRYPQDSGPQVVAVDMSTLVDQVVVRLQETGALPTPRPDDEPSDSDSASESEKAGGRPSDEWGAGEVDVKRRSVAHMVQCAECKYDNERDAKRCRMCYAVLL
jgi:hypothetical protein